MAYSIYSAPIRSLSPYHEPLPISSGASLPTRDLSSHPGPGTSSSQLCVVYSIYYICSIQYILYTIHYTNSIYIARPPGASLPISGASLTHPGPLFPPGTSQSTREYQYRPYCGTPTGLAARAAKYGRLEFGRFGAYSDKKSDEGGQNDGK